MTTIETHHDRAGGSAGDPGGDPKSDRGSVDAAKLAAAVDRAREEMAPLDEDIRKRADALVKARESFLAAGVREMVRRLKADEGGRAVLFEMVEDPLVYAVLMELGIVRPDVMTRAARAIERIRPYISGHGGDVELVRVSEESGEKIAYVRLHGACSGCSMSASTLRDGVEEAIRAQVPEISRVEELKGGPVAGVVQLTVGASSAVENALDASVHGWYEGPKAEDVPEGACVRVAVGDADAILVRRDGRLFAYRNACPHQGLHLHDGVCEGETLTCPWHGMQFDLTNGECLNEPQVQLEPFPLRVEEGVVWIRPGGLA